MERDVLPVLDQLVPERLLGVGRVGRESGHPVDHVAHEVEPVQVVADHHVERRGGGSLLLVSPDVEVPVVRPPVRQPVDQPRVAVIGEEDRLVGCEQGVELDVRQAVGVLFIEPGSSWGNGYIESFNGKLQDELLNRKFFYTLIEARVLIELDLLPKNLFRM